MPSQKKDFIIKSKKETVAEETKLINTNFIIN